MPRPKPPEDLKPRQVRLSERQWQRLLALGGADWLRRTLSNKGQHLVTRQKVLRNRNVRIDRAAGMEIKAIAEKYSISWRTVLRILE